MDEFLVLLGLVALALPILLIVVLVSTVKLQGRVRQLEYALTELRTGLGQLQAGEAPPTPATSTPEQAKPASAAAAAVSDAVVSKTKSTAIPPVDRAASPQTPTAPQQPAADKPAKPAKPSGPPKAVVFSADRFSALTEWVKLNWIYVVSAVSLALAGLFLLQYGIEAGFFPPTTRVLVALGFGAALVAGGEYVRRRWGDRPEVATANLPSVFSGAGIVTLFSAVLAALHLYALISAGVALIGLIAVAGLAVGLGWYSGPLLAAIGIIGAFAAPFVVGGESDVPQLFYGYFALVALVGLAIDAGRRWAWVSVLTLVLAYPALWLLYQGSGWPELLALSLVGLVLASLAIPTFALLPAHGGAAVIDSFAPGHPRGWPAFPTRLAAGSVAASTAMLVAITLDRDGFWIVAIALVALFGALALWAHRAEALEDLAVLPPAALLALPVIEAMNGGPLYRALRAVLTAEEGTPVPNDPYILVAFSVAVALAAAWRSRNGARWPIAWAAGAALVPPAMIAALEITWQPADVYGAYPWALTAIAVAILMTALALVFARADKSDKARISGFALAAFAMIAFALTLILSDTALTVALAVTTLAAALFDRRFDLRALSAAVQVGAILLAWRLIIDPGLGWAENAPYWELFLGYGTAIVALFAADYALRPRLRPATHAVAESAGWTLAAVFASVLVARVVEDAAPNTGADSHWGMGLLAFVWIAAMANQLWRTQVGGKFARVRWVLAGLYAVAAALFAFVALSEVNPALSSGTYTRVLGPVVLNSLFLAYALPGIALAALAWRFDFLSRKLRLVLAGLGAGLGLVWLGLDIRHFWRGDLMHEPGFSDPELYSYTIAMLVVGGGLLYQAIARRSDGLRKLGMGVIALTIAKVFLVDMSGLVGLLRVFSFLALGLSLAGLAFLNRWAAQRVDEGDAGSAPPDAPGPSEPQDTPAPKAPSDPESDSKAPE